MTFLVKFQVPYLLKNSCKLEIPCLKQLQLLSYTFDVDNQSLISFLGAASLIEKLEIHVRRFAFSVCYLHVMDSSFHSL
jgi:hypothetical protein